MMERLQGVAALTAMFAAAANRQQAAFLPYFPVGFPDYATSLDAIEQMAALGVDGFELGMPFSDPLADGPVIQAATQTALDNGVTISKCLEAVRELRQRGVQQPLLLMGYLNPILAYGAERFVTDAQAAGADGFIIPDLPPEEADLLSVACDREGLGLVFFLAPTSSVERMQIVDAQARGFIYVVSLTGVTGARSALPENLTALIERLRAHTQHKLVLGFGISTAEQAQQMNSLVDGFIVGSALVRAAQEGGAAAVARLTRAIRG